VEFNSLRVTRIITFAALYVATIFIPVSMFIGAPSLLSLNLIITPAIAILLTPIESFCASLLGAVISLYAAPFQAIFGPYTILLPVVGSTLGSLAFHKPKTGILASLYLGSVSLAYLIVRPEFPYWIIPHIIGAIIVGGASFTHSLPIKTRIPLYAYISTVCEQATMLIGAVYILSLPCIVFTTAFPLMIYERILGTIGGTLLCYSVKSIFPTTT